LLDYIEHELDVVAPVTKSDRPQRVLKMHLDIIDAIASGDVERTAAAARMHPLPPEVGPGVQVGAIQPYPTKERAP
jgi:hypothetical protein